MGPGVVYKGFGATEPGYGALIDGNHVERILMMMMWASGINLVHLKRLAARGRNPCKEYG
jgi:hypothetical protein